MLDQLEDQREEDELNNNESESGKTDSTLSSDQIIYSMTETESGSDPQAHEGNETQFLTINCLTRSQKYPLENYILQKPKPKI